MASNVPKRLSTGRGKIGLTIQTSGIAELVTRIEKRANFLGSENMRAMLRDLGAEIVERYFRKIETFNPGPVKDLTASYKRRKKAAVGFEYPILYRTGELAASMHARVLSNPWRVRIEFWGTHDGGISNKRLAQIHATGDGNMPRRDFTKLPDGWNRAWLNRLRQALRRIRR